MNRRNFIRNTALLAAAGSFLPQLFAQGPSSIEIVSIPKGLPQIRHGLLLPETGQQLLSSCPWLGKVDYQHFLRNGLEEGEEGMKHYNIELANQDIQIAFEGKDIWVSTADEVKKVAWSENIQSKDFHFQFVQTDLAEEQIYLGDSLALVIKGDANINNQLLETEQLTYWKPTSQLQIAPQSALILISKI